MQHNYYPVHYHYSLLLTVPRPQTEPLRLPRQGTNRNRLIGYRRHFIDTSAEIRQDTDGSGEVHHGGSLGRRQHPFLLHLRLRQHHEGGGQECGPYA